MQRPLPDVALDLPGGEGVAGSKDLFDLLQTSTLGLGIHEEDVDGGSAAEGAVEEVG